MITQKSLLVVGVILAILLPLATAQLIFKQDATVDLKVPCSFNGTFCDADTPCEITIYYPNTSLMVDNASLTNTGNGMPNITLPDTSVIGNYQAFATCTQNSVSGESSFEFRITALGDTTELEDIYVYAIGLIFLVALIFGTAFIIRGLPSKDAVDERGAIVQVSMLKHLRNVLWVFIWGISLAIVFIISNIGLMYLPNIMLGKLFFVIYQIMFWMTIVAVPIYFIWIFYKLMKDKELQNMIKRGAQIKGTP